MALLSNILVWLRTRAGGRFAAMARADVVEALNWACQIGASGALAIFAARMLVALKSGNTRPEG